MILFSVFNILNYTFFANDFILTLTLFLFGLFGIIYSSQNFLVAMLFIELMYFGLTISFLFSSAQNLNSEGQIYSIIYVVIAAAESAIGLGLLIVLYRFNGNINFQNYKLLRG